jgi:carboxyl-terminal processing protease
MLAFSKTSIMEPKIYNVIISRLIHRAGPLVVCFCLLINAAAAQNNNDPRDSKNAKAARKLGIEMLREIKSILSKDYYDPNFHGVNLDERFKVAEERVSALETYPQVYRAVAQVVIEFNDSHTNFYPPRMTKTADYGFSWQMIGDKCYVVDVKKGSDAEVKGLRIGDVITGIGNYNPTRQNLWLITYLFYRLDPKERLRVFVEAPGGSERELLIQSKIMNTEDVIRDRLERNQEPYRCEELNSELIACKLYTFSVEKTIIDSMMKQVRKHKKVILDLRGNGGGHVATEIHLTGYFFEHDVKIGEEKTRRTIEQRIAKTHKEKACAGDLIVLIDSKSMSASEVFARVIQLEKRGKVIGDVSAGRVMTSLHFPLFASKASASFGLNVTVGDLIMSDGKSLEGVGVIPDKAIGPTGQALAEGTDPVLAYAAGMFGVQLTPERAGKLFFIKPRN